MVLANLTEAQLEFAREDEDDRLTTDFLDQPTFIPEDIGLPPSFQRRKRQNEGPTASPRSFDDTVVVTALENQNACNPVLRASSSSIIEQLDM